MMTIICKNDKAKRFSHAHVYDPASEQRHPTQAPLRDLRHNNNINYHTDGAVERK